MKKKHTNNNSLSSDEQKKGSESVLSVDFLNSGLDKFTTDVVAQWATNPLNMVAQCKTWLPDNSLKYQSIKTLSMFPCKFQELYRKLSLLKAFSVLSKLKENY